MTFPISITVSQIKTELYKFKETAEIIIKTTNSANSDIVVFHELVFGYTYDDLFLQPDLTSRNKINIKHHVSEFLFELTETQLSQSEIFLNFEILNNFYLQTLNSINLILESGCTTNKLIVISCPMQHMKKLYNCNIFISNNQIVLIRPKVELANESHYHEPRHFSYYEYRESNGNMKTLETFTFPSNSNIKQKTAPFGVAILQAQIGKSFVNIGSEICEELWCEHPTLGDYQIMNNVDILINTSSSYFELDKLDLRMNLVKNASTGIVYVYCNNSGEQSHNSTCMDGASMVYKNCELLTIMEQFSAEQIQTSTVTFDLENLQTTRQKIQIIDDFPVFHVIPIVISINQTFNELTQIISHPVLIDRYEQCLYAMMYWLWGYYVKSGATFLFLPLSGGMDSGLTSAIVFGMCKKIIANAFKTQNKYILKIIIERLKNTNFLNDPMCHLLQNIVSCYSENLILIKQLPDFTPELLHELAKQICKFIHVTVYLASEHSSLETFNRAKNLSNQTGSTFLSETITAEYNAFKNSLNYKPNFGNFFSEDIALECLQARCRMVKIYELCQLYSISSIGYNPQSFGIVLAASNSSELFTGYWTKYDAGSADLCLIGGCSKPLINILSKIASNMFNLDSLESIINAVPTAELKPSDSQQTDEGDMGFTYKINQLFSSLTSSSHFDFIDIFNLMLQGFDSISSNQHNLISREKFITLLVEKLRKYIWRSFSNIHKRIIATQSIHIEKSDPDYKRAYLLPNNVNPNIIINDLLLLAQHEINFHQKN